MKQLTIRGFNDELTREIQRIAKREGISLNQAVLKLLRKGAGLAEHSRENTIGASLDHLIGTWTAEEAEQVDRALEDFEEIDESMWR